MQVQTIVQTVIVGERGGPVDQQCSTCISWCCLLWRSWGSLQHGRARMAMQVQTIVQTVIVGERTTSRDGETIANRRAWPSGKMASLPALALPPMVACCLAVIAGE